MDQITEGGRSIHEIDKIRKRLEDFINFMNGTTSFMKLIKSASVLRLKSWNCSLHWKRQRQLWSKEEKEELRQDLGEVDLQEMKEMWDKTCGQEATNKPVDDLMEPVPASICSSVAASSKEVLKEYEEVALRAAARGQVGVLLLAGGQGT